MAKGMMDKCTCTPASFIWVIVASVIMGVGLWLLVGGLQGQWGGASWSSVLLWYALGFIVMGIGKMVKKKAMMWPVHGMH